MQTFDLGDGLRKPTVSFVAEVERRFEFLVDRNGLVVTDHSDDRLLAVRYHGAGLAIWIFFNDDTHDGAGRWISVQLTLTTDDGTAKAELGELVEAAVFAPRHRVAWKAHTGEAMCATLDDNAMWVSRLWPLLQQPDAVDLMRTAARFERDKAGNPKRRPRNITWKYA